MPQQWQAVGNNVYIRLAQDLNLRSPVPETNALQQRSTKIRIKKLFHPKSVHFSCPKLREEQNRSSLKFSPIFCPKLGEEQKKCHLVLASDFLEHNIRPYC